MAMQWHKRILRDFSLGLEDRTASSYQGCLSGSGLVISIQKTVMTGRGKKRKNILIGILLLSWVDFLRDESFLRLSYPVLLQPESQVFLGQGEDSQAG